MCNFQKKANASGTLIGRSCGNYGNSSLALENITICVTTRIVPDLILLVKLFIEQANDNLNPLKMPQRHYGSLDSPPKLVFRRSEMKPRRLLDYWTTQRSRLIVLFEIIGKSRAYAANPIHTGFMEERQETFS